MPVRFNAYPAIISMNGLKPSAFQADRLTRSAGLFNG